MSPQQIQYKNKVKIMVFFGFKKNKSHSWICSYIPENGYLTHCNIQCKLFLNTIGRPKLKCIWPNFKNKNKEKKMTGHNLIVYQEGMQVKA